MIPLTFCSQGMLKAGLGTVTTPSLITFIMINQKNYSPLTRYKVGHHTGGELKVFKYIFHPVPSDLGRQKSDLRSGETLTKLSSKINPAIKMRSRSRKHWMTHRKGIRPTVRKKSSAKQPDGKDVHRGIPSDFSILGKYL